MSADTLQNHLPWIESHHPLPSVENAWGRDTDAPGLLAAGADLGVDRLLEAYAKGVFPWYNPNQPVHAVIMPIALFKLQSHLE